MTSSLRPTVRFLPGLIGIAILLVLLLLVSGCTQLPAVPWGTQTPAVTTTSVVKTPTPMDAGGKKMVTFTEMDGGKTEIIGQNTRFAIELSENPTTGYMWEATLSPGLVLQSSDFRQPAEAAGMVGSGGTRTWIILGKDLGNQKFSAAYRRSWEKVTSDDTTYNVNITVVQF